MLTNNFFHFLALGVIPSHSYALLEHKDNVILGNPNLNVHGDIQSVTGGGLELNGVSDWIDGHFKGTDCLIDPGLCPDGFSISGKFKFDESVKGYADARYVLDTGAHGGSSRGISVYLKGGKLHFQLTTSAKTWTVSYLFVYSFSSSLPGTMTLTIVSLSQSRVETEQKLPKMTSSSNLMQGSIWI